MDQIQSGTAPAIPMRQAPQQVMNAASPEPLVQGKVLALNTSKPRPKGTSKDPPGQPALVDPATTPASDHGTMDVKAMAMASGVGMTAANGVETKGGNVVELLRPGSFVRLRNHPQDLPPFELIQCRGGRCWVRQQAWGQWVKWEVAHRRLTASA